MLKKTLVTVAVAAGVLGAGTPAFAAIPEPAGADVINQWHTGPVCLNGTDEENVNVRFTPHFLHPHTCHFDFH